MCLVKTLVFGAALLVVNTGFAGFFVKNVNCDNAVISYNTAVMESAVTTQVPVLKTNNTQIPTLPGKFVMTSQTISPPSTLNHEVVTRIRKNTTAYLQANGFYLESTGVYFSAGTSLYPQNFKLISASDNSCRCVPTQD